METDAEFVEKFKKSYGRDMVVMLAVCVFSIVWCGLQFYLKHYGLAFLFALLAFVNSILTLVYYVFYNKTKRLFEQVDKMTNEIIEQMEKDGKL